MMSQNQEEFEQPLLKKPRLSNDTSLPNHPHFEQPLPKKPRLSNEPSLPNHQQNHFPIPTMQIPPPNLPPMNPPQNHRSASGLFYKTRPCKEFDRGNCMRGEHCSYAHGPGELRQPPPNWQEIVTKEPFGYMNEHKVCKKFCNGERCPYGDRCNFLHVRKDTGPNYCDFGAGEKMMGSSQCGSNCNDNSWFGTSFGGDGYGNDQRSTLWKTKLCHKYEKIGHCPYGDKCNYAHGLAELKKLGGDMNIRRANFDAVPSETLSERTLDASLTNEGTLPEQTLDASPTKPQTTCSQETRQDKKLSEWKGPKKISRVYGDWIDDYYS